MCLCCAANTLYYLSNSNNSKRLVERTNTHKYIKTLGEQLFHTQRVTSNPYPLLSEIVPFNSYARKEYKIQLVDKDVPYTYITDHFDKYIEQNLPILSKWTRTTSVYTHPNPVTVTHVLLTSTTSAEPSLCDYTVFFSNDTALHAQLQQTKKRRKSKHQRDKPNALTTLPTVATPPPNQTSASC